MSYKILVVDDEEDLAENLADLLELGGFEVEISFSGEDALEKIDIQKPSLVLLDYQLTGMDGLEVLHNIKEEHPNIPVFMVSASSQKEIIEKIDEYGGDAMVLKPYDQDELLSLIISKLPQKT